MYPVMLDNRPQPRRVLMTADTVGGVWTYALELARALNVHGIDVALATMGAPLSVEQRAEVRSLSQTEVFEGTFRLEWMADPWDDVERAGDWLLELEEKICPDVVHLNGYVHGALPWRAPKIVVGHSCVVSWWWAVHGEGPPSEWDRYGHQVARGLRAADLVLAPSQAMLTALEQHYGPLPDSRVIANGRTAALFRPRAKEPFVLAVGRLWDKAKNIRALERLAPRLPWPIYVAGEEQHPDGGMATLQGVRLLGQLGPLDLAPWFGRASIYVLSARYEPFGLSALEAALAGCALVLGDIPSLREVWGDAALFVGPDDGEALRAALERLIADEDYRGRLAMRARARALPFSPERMAASYLAAYRAVMPFPFSREPRVTPRASADDHGPSNVT